MLGSWLVVVLDGVPLRVTAGEIILKLGDDVRHVITFCYYRPSQEAEKISKSYTDKDFYLVVQGSQYVIQSDIDSLGGRCLSWTGADCVVNRIFIVFFASMDYNFIIWKLIEQIELVNFLWLPSI